jgi:hypothetical protein
MEPTNGTIVSNTIRIQPIVQEIEQASINDEGFMHKKEHYLSKVYFKEIIDVIKDYDEVLLFGSTDAKNELFNLLKEDRNYDKIKIEMRSTDKLTENQRHAFVKEYFSEK